MTRYNGPVCTYEPPLKRNESMHCNIRDRVDISLEKYESMRDEIKRLTDERDDWRSKFETLKAFLEETHLPLDALGSGKGQDIKCETQLNPMDMSVRYNISVTVQDVDLYKKAKYEGV